MTKQQQAQAERERVINELHKLLDNNHYTIYSITQRTGTNHNGARTSTARYYIINAGERYHITHHVALLYHGRQNRTPHTATIQGWPKDAVKHISELLYSNPHAITAHELNG